MAKFDLFDDKTDLFDEDDLYPDISIVEDDDLVEEPFSAITDRLSKYAKKNLTYVLLNRDGELYAVEIADLLPEEFADWAISRWPTLNITRSKLLEMTKFSERNMVFESIVASIESIRRLWIGKSQLSFDGM